jgi:hypothetical protein
MQAATGSKSPQIHPTTPINASTQAASSSTLKNTNQPSSVNVSTKKATTSMAKINAPSKQVDLNKQFKSPLPTSPSKTAVSSSSSKKLKNVKSDTNLSKKMTPVEEDPIETYPSQYDLTGEDDVFSAVPPMASKNPAAKSNRRGTDVDIERFDSDLDIDEDTLAAFDNAMAGGPKSNVKGRTVEAVPTKRVGTRLPRLSTILGCT